MNRQRLLSPRTERLVIDISAAGLRRLRGLGHNGHDSWTAHRPSNRTLATTAGSAAAMVGAYALIRYAIHHRHVEHEDYEEAAVPGYRLVRLYDLRRDDEALAEIQAALLAEWGPFAPPDLTAMRSMADRAGRLAFVLGRDDDGEFKPAAILQTARADTGGDPTRLVAEYPMFSSITRHGSWRDMNRGGDTAVLLQITALGERSHGAGSLLRDAALHALPKDVRFALTTTPVDDFDLAGLPENYPPQVKFHYRGGARPAGYREGYKIAPAGETGGRQHHQNVVFMRYERNEDGSWQGVRKPDLALTRPRRRSLIATRLRRRKPAPAAVPEPDVPAAVLPA
jgi:hypothetical protein